MMAALAEAPTAVSYASKLVASRQVVHLTAENEVGRKQHAYVETTALKAAALMEVWRIGAITDEAGLAAYGKVLAVHFGRFPREDVREMLRATYGVEV